MKGHLLTMVAAAAISLGGLAHGASAATIGVTMDKFDDNFLTSVRNAITDQAKAKGVSVQIEDANDDNPSTAGTEISGSHEQRTLRMQAGPAAHPHCGC